MVSLQLSYNLDKLKDIIDERTRLIDVLKLTPSKNDTTALKRQCSSVLDVLNDQTASDITQDQIDLYNKLIESIPDKENVDLSLYRFEATPNDSMELLGSNESSRTTTSKKVRFNDDELVSYNSKEEVFKPYSDEPEQDKSHEWTTSGDNVVPLVSNKDLFIQQQQQLMQQDSHIEQLSSSVQRTHDMSLDINNEIEEQNEQVLHDLEDLIDNNSRHLNRAQRRLEIFNKAARENGPCFIIVILILILLFLLIIL
ncbi:hypothetical protein Kpol_1044p8 [Vanderwaltozyma polyspora DSM 70294]|uniref:t-SNARE coiled-coil homology domain-containing protein n=1 Tax=Vanderwaltozyma polyspora (strain ATCC 22028 / DSM 70294 / BCRC 21397 / CBS 2163 / NBRC 10782 / NRRL Y-8283 / UCD 57-17) TaxID=436907 RepID=A7TP39_VANPO|nr:uncharacterized protein Kpol_1044p8 [Vanderwaltozyma polyspora DSM 70294]EDO15949.1 hypothetical protein Kpol_1044p8 [Vanderwaltozyma polyspora DSM 70294]